MSDQAPAAKTNSVDSHELLHRAGRFTVTVMIPVAVGLIKGIDTWLVFAVLGAILSFVGDEGGKPLTRLAYMAAGPLSLLAGAALGALRPLKKGNSWLATYCRVGARRNDTVWPGLFRNICRNWMSPLAAYAALG